MFEEIESLKRRLEAAKKEIAALNRKSRQEGNLPVLRKNAFAAAVEQTGATCRRTRGPGCLARVSLNSLSEILDRHGDEAGDFALHHIASLLAGHVRQTDSVGRVGTGTFGVLLAHAELPGATAKMDRMMAKVERAPCIWEGKHLPIMVSYTISALANPARG